MDDTSGGTVAAPVLVVRTLDDARILRERIVDHYFWTEIAGVSLKVVGPLPVPGPPTTLEDAGDGHGVFTWDGPTVVAYGVRRSVAKLRATARSLSAVTW